MSIYRTGKANTGEIVPILLFICINTARVVLTRVPLASIVFFTESTHVLLLTGTGKSCLKHKKNTVSVTWRLSTVCLGCETQSSKEPLPFYNQQSNQITYVII